MNESFHRVPAAHGAEPVSDTDRYASALECLIGGSLAEWAPGGMSPFALLRVAEHHALFHEGSPTHSVYVVQAGFFKIVRTGEDGYEHVLDFAGRHDLLGCDGLANGEHPSSAVALEESWVYALPMAEVRRLTQRLPGFSARWESAMSAQIGRAGELAWLMAAVGAEKRTARFISLYAQRMAERGQSSRRLLLRMSRRDIASHLGLAHESVSRSFTLLAEAGVLLVDNREIEIIDPDALHRYAFSTRGYPPAVPRHPLAIPADVPRPALRVVACA
jgi:CRP/FNR family transcriptional regulator, anaerobic regulatory protein